MVNKRSHRTLPWSAVPFFVFVWLVSFSWPPTTRQPSHPPACGPDPSSCLARLALRRDRVRILRLPASSCPPPTPKSSASVMSSQPEIVQEKGPAAARAQGVDNDLKGDDVQTKAVHNVSRQPCPWGRGRRAHSGRSHRPSSSPPSRSSTFPPGARRPSCSTSPPLSPSAAPAPTATTVSLQARTLGTRPRLCRLG